METYQAIYDAVRSRISNGDIGESITSVARQSFDISHTVAILSQEFSLAAYELMQAGREQQRPFVLMRPKIYLDGNSWCALYGENLQDGICGFGDTPEKASIAFDAEWITAIAKEKDHE